MNINSKNPFPWLNLNVYTKVLLIINMLKCLFAFLFLAPNEMKFKKMLYLLRIVSK